MDFRIDLGVMNRVFAVPCDVVDKYMRLATGAALKTLLFLLRHGGRPFSPQEVSQALNLSEPDVKDAFDYWVSAGLFDKPVFSEQTAGAYAEVAAPPPAAASPVPTQPALPVESHQITENLKVISRTPPKITFEEAAKIMNENPDLRAIMQYSQQIFQRELSRSEISALVSLYDYAKIEPDVLLMILEFCKVTDRLNMHYIEKTAYSFLNDGLNSHDKAAKQIEMLTQATFFENKIKSAFGLGSRALTKLEKETISLWSNVYHFDIAMIKIAYEKTVNTINKVSFSYINKILQSWYDKGIQTPDQAMQELKKPGGAISGAKPSFSTTDYEQEALFQMPKF